MLAVQNFEVAATLNISLMYDFGIWIGNNCMIICLMNDLGIWIGNSYGCLFNEWPWNLDWQ
jgi:hypothetical protein